MKKIFVVIIFLLYCSTSFGQLLNLNSADGRPILLEKSNLYEGSPYLDDNFNSILITLKGSKEYETIGRLNCLNKVFEYKVNGELYEIDFSEIESIKIKESGLVYKSLNLKENDKGNLFQILIVGDNISLVKKIDFTLMDQNTDSYSNTLSKRRVVRNETIFIFAENRLNSFKKNQKSFLSILPLDEKKKAENYLKMNKVNFNKEEELVLLFSKIAN